jgi:hypothetical protein
LITLKFFMTKADYERNCEDSFVRSTAGDPPESIGSNPIPRSTFPELYLEVCSANDPRYQNIRQRHYVQKKGTHGQQVHFLVWYQGKRVGIISGASAVYATADRDVFFKITKENRKKVLNGIIDNVVFRLELNKQQNHLASKIVLLWEEACLWMWEKIYEVKVFGFETFIVNEGFVREEVLETTDNHNRPMRHSIIVEDPSGKNVRTGGTYRAAGWLLAGETSGSTKGHDKVGLTGGKPTALNPDWDGVTEEDRYLRKGVYLRKAVPIKAVYCKLVRGLSAPIESDYKSSWKANTFVGTPKEKALAKRRTKVRRELLGTRFYHLNRKLLVHEDLKLKTKELIKRNAPQAKCRERKLRSSREQQSA